MAIVFAVIIMLALFGGLGGTMFWLLKKTDPNRLDTSIKDNIDLAQDFLPFEELDDYMVHLGGHQYRAYIEVGGLNYFLQTKDEQDLVELSFQRFVNSLGHGVSFYIQTRVTDNAELLKELKEDYVKTASSHPGLSNFIQRNYAEMEEMYLRRGTEREKRKYIIVPFDEAAGLTESDDEAKREYAAEELLQRCYMIKDSLSNIGLSSKILNQAEIFELLMSTYHRDNYSQAKAIIEGEYSDLILSGPSKMDDITDSAKLDWILYEAQKKLQTELFSQTNDDEMKQRVRRTMKELDALRDAVAGYYKSN